MHSTVRTPFFNLLAAAAASSAACTARAQSPVEMGKDAFGDWTTDAPGVRRHITVADLPPPYSTPSVDHGANVVPRPDGALPKAPAGFKVEVFATDLHNPRKIVTAPNGDIFVAESGPGHIRVLRDTKGTGKADVVSVFAEGLDQPFGIAFYPPGPNPQYVYVGNTGSVVRIPYHNGDLKATGPAETLAEIPSGGRLRGGGHWTRDVAFSADGKRMWVSVGSATNDMNGSNDPPKEVRRANILEFTPDGKNEKTYAWGVRNAVGLAVQPRTGDLWMSVNERDALGDMLPPDYISHVTPDAFYGWPWYYLGDHQDPRHVGEKPELAGRITVPDVLLQAHSASLALTFTEGLDFGRDYRNGIFACEHGSWNRDRRTGYKVIFVPLDRRGRATGEYDDFITGFVNPDGTVWGRPVGITVGKDGCLYFSDDATNTVWRVSKTK